MTIEILDDGIINSQFKRFCFLKEPVCSLMHYLPAEDCSNVSVQGSTTSFTHRSFSFFYQVQQNIRRFVANIKSRRNND